MTCYVDDVRHRFRGMIMCHLWADSTDELFAMADKIGVRPRWLQQPPRASWVHFDISLGMKARAIANGAVLTDRYGPLEHLAKLHLASGNPALIAAGERRIALVAAVRGMAAKTKPKGSK